ncbi:MAG: Methenyltetrahydromethanopterin cyclohydrolase [Methanoculleus marisnigri]|jgi:methenyltetrahydromethanopterin cyclohydrolase|uniref:Methenyltetrahydromethanopterin cyclohydrolase n=1 Tax=Methanoculleus marisnigri TaxID=2198 RepID=A0A117MI43_9EURY|nr:methenyltetrahydromethanopterin cyclohydrolase [Methanoculleus marisnigri]KUK63594.1 MAG: Methenyltetrahydromethanopterin cyclohydrolase [Methanoculleus marisnigri]KUL05428.1 MAG: Methenyltetrahydromethanopterin cyclohydrolase [Methanoculleus marisnigri]
MLSINSTAMPAVREMIDRRDELRVAVAEQENGVTCIDCGVHVPGSYRAGTLFVEACLGGLATTAITMDRVGDVPVPFLNLVVSHPALACLGSQKAGWVLKVGNYSAMASGPARALAAKPKETYRKIGYHDTSRFGILALEADTLPDEEVTGFIAEKCGIDPENLYVLVAPTRSLVGSVQISGRVVTATLHKLEERGYDTLRISHAAGRSPIAPVKRTGIEAMGATNDCNIYYGSVSLVAEGYDPVFATLPSQTSPDYGRPFGRVLKDAGYDFLKVDSLLAFSPAEVTINDSTSGEVYHFGSLNADVLLESFGVRSTTPD